MREFKGYEHRIPQAVHKNIAVGVEDQRDSFNCAERLYDLRGLGNGTGSSGI